MKRLLILGGGYGGLATAQKYDALTKGRGEWEIVILDHRDYHLLQVRVHEVAANSVSATRVKVPFKELLADRNIKFVQAWIEKIEPEAHQVLTSEGTITYDRLLVSLGSITYYPNVPGMREHSFPMKDLEDAIAYRKAVVTAFKEATKPGAEPLRKNDPRLTFIIVGGGLTGTELAGEMVDFCNDLCKRFPEASKAYRIVLVEGHDHLLMSLDRAHGEYVKAELTAKNVAVFVNTYIDRIDVGDVHLKNDRIIRGNIICWAGGIKAPDLIKHSGFKTDESGRIVTDQFLRCTQYPDVYAVGDNAYIPDPNTGRGVPWTGQYAERQGYYIAESLFNEERKQKVEPYKPFSLGISISLGREEALTLSGPLRLTGMAGRLAKDFSYNNYEITIRNKPVMEVKAQSINNLI